MNSEEAPIGSATARFIAGSRERAFSPEVLDMAKKCLVDWFACGLGAMDDPAVEAVRRIARAMGGTGGAGSGRGALMLPDEAAAPALAALVNGTCVHAMDFDDTHQTGGSHLSGPTWAAVLAVAGDAGLSEQAALAAFITGYEVGARLAGTAMAPALHYRGFHPTAIFGRFSAAAACCVLLGLDEQRTAHALGLAATQAGGLNASFGTMAKPFHAGKAAMDGILSAQLAAEDFQAATNLLDVENGLSRALVQDGEARIENVEFSAGESLLQNVFKAYACCRATHPAMDAARSLAGAVEGREIARVILQVNPSGLHVANKTRPATPLEAKFSFPYVVALGLSGRQAAGSDFEPERFAEPALQGLAGRVELEVNPEVQRYASVMDVHLAGGATLHADVPHALGNPENPMGWHDLQAKFHAAAAKPLGPNASKLYDALRTFEQPGRLPEIIALMRGG